MKLVLSREAENDIFTYTLEKFGEKQAEVYLVGLKSFFLELTTKPNLGKSLE